MTDVVMPQMGESITEGTLTKWLKQKGDQVEIDEPLFEISTDKVDTEIPAPVAGTLSELLVEEGATVEINTVVARIAANGAGAAPAAAEPVQAVAEPISEPAAEPVQAAPASYAAEPEPVQAESSTDGVPGPLSPLVRRMARENDVDLRKVKGSGAGGRITKEDVQAYLAGAQTAPAPAAVQQHVPAQPAAPPPPPPQPQTSSVPAVQKTIDVPPPAAPEMPRGRVEPMTNMRQRIAEHMIYSKHTSAHVTTVHRVDMTRIAKLRNAQKGEFKQRYGYSLTFLPFLAKATTQALLEFPLLNSSIEGTNIVYHNEINLGIAVALENGLLVPVIRNADELSIAGLQRSIVDLANRARSRQLKPDEVQGATFSITNFGSFGSIMATPVINQPNVAILGIGAVTKEPIVTQDDSIAIRSMAYVSLTFDHRLIDGALADQFTGRVKQILEDWSDQSV